MINVNKAESLFLVALAKQATNDQFKNLNTKERTYLLKIANSVLSDRYDVKIDKETMRSLEAKLKLRIASTPPKKTPLEKIKFTCQKLLNIRISVSKITDAYKKIDINNLKKNIKSEISIIEKSLSKNKEDLIKINDIIKYENEFLSGHYRTMANLYKDLNSDTKTASKKIYLLIIKTTMEISKLNKEDPDFKDKEKVLKNEILGNLKKMLGVANSNGKNWETELKINEDVWERTAKNTEDHKLEKPVIEKLQEEINLFSEQKNRLSKQLKHL